MAEKTIVNYEQMQAFVKKFESEGEALAQWTGKLRQAVHHLQSEWIGAGSESFFDEMETLVLPAMQRLSEAILFTANTTTGINKIYHQAEDEGSRLFGDNLGDVQLGATDFGTGQFGDLGNSGAASGVDLGSTDFGAGQFGEGFGQPAGGGGGIDPGTRCPSGGDRPHPGGGSARGGHTPKHPRSGRSHRELVDARSETRRTRGRTDGPRVLLARTIVAVAWPGFHPGTNLRTGLGLSF